MDSKLAKPSARALFFGLIALVAILGFSIGSTPAWAYTYSNSGTLTYEKDGNTVTKNYTDPEELLDDADDADVDVTIDMNGDWNTEDVRLVSPAGVTTPLTCTDMFWIAI